MPEKLGNGGHSYEKYDPNTGKYVADGQPNKYYDNPAEKNFANSSLKEKYKDFLNSIEENEELNALFGWKPKENKEYEKYTKPISEMSKEELENEINEHYNYLKQYHIKMEQFQDCFNYDLKLKCANFRQMYKMMEKYQVKLENCDFINSHLLSKDGTTASIGHYLDYKNGFMPNIQLTFNDKQFQSYEQVIKDEKEQAVISKWHPKCDEENYAFTAFNHEYGHAIFDNYLEKTNIFSRENINETYDKVLTKMLNNQIPRMKITVLPDGKRNFVYKNVMYINSEAAIQEFAKDLTKKELRKEHLSQGKKVIKEVFAIFVEQNPDIIDKKRAFESEKSGYTTDKKSTSLEWFAETFASLEGGKPTKSALALKEWLKRKGYLKGE